MTFNVHHCAPRRGIARVRRVADVIRSQRPDIVGVQELERGVPRSWFRDQPRSASRVLGMDRVFTPTHRYGPWGVLGYAGNAMLSQLPIERVRNWLLPAGGSEHRFATFARLGRGTSAFTMVNAHLVNDDPSAALRQLDALLGELTNWPRPWVLTGDLNMTADHVHAPITEAGMELVDVGPTSPAHAPRRTLDWIAYADFDLVDAHVPDTTVSDHRPVVATFVLPRTLEA